jgi:hypothetical protein
MPAYTVTQFNKDLKQLGGMIENFYTQQGGQPRRRQQQRKQNSMSQKQKQRRRQQQRGGAKKPQRNFKILSVNGKPYPIVRPYKGAEPKDAAKKAGRFACKKLQLNKYNNKTCNITFKLKETTRGSDKRVYGPYKGKFVKRNKPKVFKFKGMKKPYTSTHEFVVSLAKSRK